MGLFSGVKMLYSGAKFFGINTDTIKNAVQKFAEKASSNVPPEKLNEKIAEQVYVQNDISPEEQQRRDENLQGLKSVLASAGGEKQSYDNVIQAIDDAPEQWGEMTKELSAETLENMEAAVQNGEDISIDMVKLTYMSPASAIDSLNDRYSANSDAEKEVNAEVSTEASDRSVQEQRYNAAASIIDNSHSDSQSQYGE